MNTPVTRNNPPKLRQGFLLSILLGAQTVVSLSVIGQDIQMVELDSGSDSASQQTVAYPATFFSKYAPATALDMVRQLPGFNLDDGDEIRGFAAAAGNILINGRRPSAKENTPSAILGHIPAYHVERIDLLRGQMKGVDLRGQTTVANIILVEGGPAIIRWETLVKKSIDFKRLFLMGNVSLSDRWGNVDYNAGLNLETSATGQSFTEDVFDGTGVLTESRVDDYREPGYKGRGNLTLSSWMADTLYQLNLDVGIESEPRSNVSLRFPQIPASPPYQEIFDDQQRRDRLVEIGVNAERELKSNLFGKAILLFFYKDQDLIPTLQSIDADGQQTSFRIATGETVTSEAIARAEFNWAGVPNHAPLFTVEGAYNSLDGSLVQLIDTGFGSNIVDVPGANSRVEELRGDFMLKDTFSSELLELDYGISWEISKISQTGDTEQDREFIYLKPHALFTYSPNQSDQTQVRLAREVSQLDFNDFVSATVYEDDDLALGNPNLVPETTWVVELSQEKRFGKVSVIKVKLFHHWISDVEDLLPLSTTFEVPGNIGDGRRWGIEVESTIPLDWLSLSGARFNVKARLQDSTVIDPVTGAQRVLSSEPAFNGTPYILYRNENRYAVIFDYRQDFESARVAWGVNVGLRAKRPLFKVNELDIYNEGVGLNAFIETTRWLGLKTRVVVENIATLTEIRDRIVFLAERSLSAIDFRELEKGQEGVRVTLSLSGSF